jgi:transcriptional regulator with XRE-family HTH domain
VAIDAVFQQDDERGSARRTLRLGVGGRLGDASAIAATVRNISASGLLIDTPAPLAEGDRFTLDLPEAPDAVATVVWSDGSLFGCRFDAPLSSAALSAAELRGEPTDPDAQASEDFGERIHRLRIERGLSLADIAQRLGVSKPTVWAWEHGKARPVDRRLPDLAQALGVTPGGLEPAISGPPEVLERSRRKIAEAYGVDAAKVRIMIEL